MEAYDLEIVKYEAYKNDPEGFIRDVLKVELFSWQKQVCDHIKNNFCLVEGENVVCPIAVAGGNNTGKSFLGRLLMVWQFACIVESRGFVLTNSEKQTKRTGYERFEGLLNKLYPKTKVVIGENKITFRNDKSDLSGIWDISFILISIHESGMTGLHDPNMLFFFDECVSFPDKIWRALDGMMTSKRVIVYCSGNPIETGNGFHRIFEDAKNSELEVKWLTMHVSEFDLPETHINHKVLRDRERRWGKNHPAVRCGIYGQFPDESVATPFSRERMSLAMNRNAPDTPTYPFKVISVDAALNGKHGAANAVCVRQGLVVHQLDDFPDDIHVFLVMLKRLIREHNPSVIIVDANGVGGIISHDLKMTLRGKEYVYEVKGSEQAVDELVYHDRRTELGWRAAQWVANSNCVLPHDPDLAIALRNVFFSVADSGKVRMTPKKDLFAIQGLRGTGVLDRMDAFFYSFAEQDAHVVGRADDFLLDSKYFRSFNRPNTNNKYRR